MKKCSTLDGENRIGTNELNNLLEINLMKQTRSRLPEDKCRGVSPGTEDVDFLKKKTLL